MTHLWSVQSGFLLFSNQLTSNLLCKEFVFCQTVHSQSIQSGVCKFIKQLTRNLPAMEFIYSPNNSIAVCLK